MTSKDLKDLLGAVADEGRETVAVDEQQVAGRIKSRRRRQSVVVAAASVGTAAVIAAAAVAIVPNLGTEQAPVAGPRQAATGVAIGGCGETVSGEPRADAPLTMSAVTGVKPVSGTTDYATIDLVVTNTTQQTLHLSTGRSAAITVAQGGKVVATPAPARDAAVQLTLLPGEKKTVTSTVGLRRCDGATTQTGGRLAAGGYQLYATQKFNPTEGGEVLEAQGGPWTVELK
ncbi:hypothetical protein Kfla_0077 [Kribbella flavida DSM 17836]|uniref:Uncharacterized protein n=1 Tax=Kribbella flavida (strain DSM 17836 / JCM 10339 / NBRC 14399) TaxID=479435 RepID=D2PQL9_KRIFD|nr:hypothetical protein [Kribbella flavida]ADB29206.1 hypothetical protein Kfla_0077 [Kribbella flavida DSM 17836]